MLVKRVHHKQDTIVMQREIDLSYGLKDKHESIFTHFFFNYIFIY